MSSFYQGFKTLLPIGVFVAVFGTAFAVAALQAGLTHGEIFWMSSLVFAGASQFGILELWGQQIPVVPLILTVFFINARHILMGAALYPYLKDLPALQRYASVLLLSDANWAYADQAYQKGQSGWGLLVGGGVALWLSWIFGSVLGMYLGTFIQQPERFGLDLVMACFLLAMILGKKPNLRHVVIWLSAGVSSLVAYLYLPEHMHVVVGALCGGLVGCVWQEDVRK